MGNEQALVSADELQAQLHEVVVLDCRFDLADADAGARAYAAGHIPGAHYVHLERDLSGPVAEHGGRHPLPSPAAFSERMARLGIDRSARVVAYDDNAFMPAARLWWMLRALGYDEVRLLNGGIAAWVAIGGKLHTGASPVQPVAPPAVGEYQRTRDVEAVRSAVGEGALLVDSRDAARYEGLEESIDPVAGHIPGAVNLPWQGVTDSRGFALDEADQRSRLAALAGDREVIVYCGSGVSACVNLLAFHLAGRDDAMLYPGSWSDWCSYL